MGTLGRGPRDPWGGAKAHRHVLSLKPGGAQKEIAGGGGGSRPPIAPNGIEAQDAVFKPQRRPGKKARPPGSSEKAPRAREKIKRGPRARGALRPRGAGKKGKA